MGTSHPVIFKAGNFILLEDNFEVLLGATFETVIEFCTLEDLAKENVEDRQNNELEGTDVAMPQIVVAPNPFSHSTTITLHLSTPQNVKLEIYDAAGQLIQQLAEQHLPKGTTPFTWQLENQLAGLYFLSLKTENDVITKKLVVQQ